jgi:hypothetical protein
MSLIAKDATPLTGVQNRERGGGADTDCGGALAALPEPDTAQGVARKEQ